MDLKDVFSEIANRMRSDLAQARGALDHAGLRGDGAEQSVRQFLTTYLPNSVDVATGEVIDSKGGRSTQLDVLLTDRHRTPLFYSDGVNRVVPAEGVLAAIEVKSRLDAGDLPGLLVAAQRLKGLAKVAHYPNSGPIVNTYNLYGRSWEAWPSLYWVFAFDSSPLQSLVDALNAIHAGLELSDRVDCICVLNQGLVFNASKGSGIDAVPYPGSSLVGYETADALLLFYMLISHNVLQPTIRPIRVAAYLGEAHL